MFYNIIIKKDMENKSVQKIKIQLLMKILNME